MKVYKAILAKHRRMEAEFIRGLRISMYKPSELPLQTSELRLLPNAILPTLGLIFLLALWCVGGCAGEAMAEESIIKIAQAEIGKGEIGGDNKGAEVKKYTKGQEVAWCAAFVSYVRSRSGDESNYFLSAKSYWNFYKDKRVKNPKSGDIICFYRGSRGGRFGHVGIVEKVDSEYIYTIEGNVGDFPAKVKRLKYLKNSIPKLLGFIRLDKGGA